MLVEQSFRKHNASGIYSVHAYFGLHDSPIRSAILYCFLQGLGSRHMAHCSYCPNAAASASPASRLRRMPRPGPLVASRTTPRLRHMRAHHHCMTGPSAWSSPTRSSTSALDCLLDLGVCLVCVFDVDVACGFAGF